MSSKYRIALRVALLALALVLVAAVLGAAVVNQREKELDKAMHAWPVADDDYQAHLRLPEGDLPVIFLVTLEEEPEALYLAAQIEGRVYVMELAPTVLLRLGEKQASVAELRSRGLPVLLECLTGPYALPVSCCLRLSGGRLAGLADRADVASLVPDDVAEGANRAGSLLLTYGALWREVFTRKGLVFHPGLQADLAGSCRVDPGIGYSNLRAWGESMRDMQASDIYTLPLLDSGWKEDEQELDGRACLDLLAIIGRGEDPASYLAEHEAARQEERKIHTLSYEPIPPAIIYGGYANRMEVAITLDDGYNQDPRILELLRSHGIRCTVFPVGSFAEQNPEWLKLMDSMGFEIANHSYTHPIYKPNRLIDLPDEAVTGELVAAQQVVWDAVGKKYPYFRPPGGWVDERVAALAADLGYVTVMWSLDSGDTANPTMSPLERADNIMARVKPGYILLFHFGGYYTYETLSYIIPRLQAQGYHFVTLSRLFQP